MSTLFYDIPLEEELGDRTAPDYKVKVLDIPHFSEIANWLPEEWDKCEIHKTFTGILKDKVQSCKMRCIQRNQGGHMKSIARVTIEFVPGFRLSEQKKQECWEQLDAQMSDGFGESYDHKQIPDGEGWRLRF